MRQPTDRPAQAGPTYHGYGKYDDENEEQREDDNRRYRVRFAWAAQRLLEQRGPRPAGTFGAIDIRRAG